MENNFSVVTARIIELKGKRSVSAFARAIGINQQTMDTYIKGRLPSAEVLIKLSTTFNVPADWLLGLTDDRGGVAPRTAQPCQISPDKRVTELEAENAALKGEIRGLQFALDSALKGARRAQASASHSRPA